VKILKSHFVQSDSVLSIGIAIHGSPRSVYEGLTITR